MSSSFASGSTEDELHFAELQAPLHVRPSLPPHAERGPLSTLAAVAKPRHLTPTLEDAVDAIAEDVANEWGHVACDH